MAVDGPILKGDKLYRVQVAGYGDYFKQPVIWEVTVTGGGNQFLILSYERITTDGAVINVDKQKVQRHVVQNQYWRSRGTAMFSAIYALQNERKRHEQAIEQGRLLEAMLEKARRDSAGVPIE